jgi:RNA 2',3'-cyclic 3'-phosphodiesterase
MEKFAMQQMDLTGLGMHGEAATQRLFFALCPDAVLRARIAERATTLHAHAGGRMSGARRYHMTLQFLGDFDDLPRQLVDDAIGAATRVVEPAFAIHLDQAGSFSNRVGWLGCSHMPEGLRQLWDALGRSLARARVQVRSGTSFVPHVTILRNVASLPATPVVPLHWPVREFMLLRSWHPVRAEYDVLGRWPLQPALVDEA